MSPKEIITKHIMKLRGVRVPEVRKAVEDAMKEIAEYDYIILERADLLKDPERLQALYSNQAMRNRDR